jgi:hypothetical protein
MLTKNNVDTTLTEISRLHTQGCKAQFIGQIADIVCDYLKYHFVGLYLIDNQTVFLKSGSGELGKLLISRNHQFHLAGNSLVSKAINSSAFWATEIRYEQLNWWYRTYKSVLPAEIQRNTDLSLELIEETQPTNWQIQSPAHPTPPGWELFLPLRIQDQTLGTVQINIWEISELTEEQKTNWWPLLVSVDQMQEPVSFVKEDIPLLQWFADQLSVIIKCGDSGGKSI